MPANKATVPPAYAPDVDFDEELFVNREVEKQLFGDILTEKQTEQRFLEFVGVAGQGKTELLKWIYITAKKSPGCLAAYIDFDLTPYHRPEIYPLLQTVIAYFELRTSPVFKAFYKKLQEFEVKFREYQKELAAEPHAANRRPVDQMEDELVQAFNKGLKSVLIDHKVVLCLDSTERADLRVLRRFEEQILGHLSDNQNLILAIAGQERVAWQLRDLRRRIKRSELSRLTPEETYEQISRLAQRNDFEIGDLKFIRERIWEITLGHPFSNFQFVNVLTSGFKDKLTHEEVKDHISQALSDLVDKVIKERMLRNLQLGDQYPPAAYVLRVLSPLRRIEFGVLWYVLTNFISEKFEGKPFSFFEELLAKFQKNTHVFTAWILGSGFDLERVARSILLEDLQQNYHSLYMDINRELDKQYDTWVHLTHDASQVKNMVERLYHYASWLGKEDSEKIQERLELALQDYCERYLNQKATGQDAVSIHEQRDRLKRALKNDEELSEMIDITRLIAIVDNN